MYAFRLVSMGLIMVVPLVASSVHADTVGGPVGPVNAECSINPDGDVLPGGAGGVLQWCQAGMAFWVWVMDEGGDIIIPLNHDIATACGLAPVNCVKMDADARGHSCTITGQSPTRVAKGCKIDFLGLGSASLWPLPGTATARLLNSGKTAQCTWGITLGVPSTGCSTIPPAKNTVTLPDIGESEAKCAEERFETIGQDVINRVVTPEVKLIACFAFVNFELTHP